ncbi:MAG: NAD(P)-dependent oxidoreductase [Clostridium sp.]|jgi:glutamate synthase (NADPH/NADH) small chain|nr:NAD(P)-dependent oxidoreductase [Clostridium sp.]
MKKIEEIRSYCLNCKNSQCRIKGCPLGNCIPEFIHEVDSKKEYEILCNTTVLPAICGRICPHEKQCEGSCIRGIKGEPVSIGAMEAYIGDLSIENNYELSIEVDERAKDKRVAVIGSGPAGLTCAAFLARRGVKVTIYEKHDKLGGLLTHGIPDFRLPREVVEKTIEKILDLGVEVKLNQELGRDFEIEDLAKKYDAVFVSIGANIPAKMNVEGENLNCVYGGNYLLEYNKHPNYTGKKVAIIGGGNVAMDSARTIKKLGASEVYVIYRRAEEQMPAEKKEIADAKKEGIEFLFQTNIVKILGKEKVEKLECIKTELVKKEGENRLSPVNIEGSNFILDMDYVVMATGSKPENNIIEKFERNEYGYIKIDENMQTSISKVFAGGDIVGQKATVAWAARSGRDAAEKILKITCNIM